MLRCAMKKLIVLVFLTGGLAMPLNNFGMQLFNALKENFFPKIDTRRVGTVLGRFQGCSPYIIYDIAQKLRDEDVVHWMNTSSAFRSILQDELIKRWGLAWYWRVNKFTFVPFKPLLLPDGRKPREIESITFSPDCGYIATGPEPLVWKTKPQIVWKLEEFNAPGEKFHKKFLETSAEIIKELMIAPYKDVYDLQFVSNSKLIGWAYDDHILFWEGQADPCMSTINYAKKNNHEEHIYSLVFAPSSGLFALGRCDHSIEIWDLSKREVKLTIPNAYYGGPIKFLSGGKILVSPFRYYLRPYSGDYWTAINFWNVEDGKLIFQLKCPEDYITSIDVSPDHTKLIVAVWSGSVWLWDISGIDEKNESYYANIQSSSRHKEVSRSFWDKNYQSDCANNQPVLLEKSGGRVRSAIFSPDGTIVAFAPRDGEIIVQEVATSKIIQQLPGTGHLAFSPDGKMLAVACKDIVGLWQVVSDIHDQ